MIRIPVVNLIREIMISSSSHQNSGTAETVRVEVWEKSGEKYHKPIDTGQTAGKGTRSEGGVQYKVPLEGELRANGF